MDIIYLGGVPEAGKTLTAKNLVSRFGFIKYIDGGQRKLPFAQAKYEKGLAVLNQFESHVVNGLFLDEVIKESSPGELILIDSHYTYPLKNRSFVNLIPEGFADKFGLYILVEASSEIISKRRDNEGKRGSKIDLGFIGQELFEERNEARRLSSESGIVLEVLDTDCDGALAVDKLESIFRKNFPDYFNVA